MKKRLQGLLLLVILASSCNNMLDMDERFFHVATQEQQWNSLVDTRSALFGIYGLMRTALGEKNTFWAAGDLRMGDFTVRTREDLQAIRDNQLQMQFPEIRQISNWNRFYKVINAASVFIENADKVLERDRAYSETNYQYDIAQARALRALAYFYMVRMWGDVPLITYSYDNNIFPDVARTDAKTVLTYAKGELLNVAPELPVLLGSSSDQYYGGSSNKWKGWLINRYAVYAILAHIAAWEGNYLDAEIYAGYILDNANSISATETTIENLVSPTGIFSVRYGDANKASRLVAFGYSYDGTNVNESSVDGHLESWTLAEPITRRALPDIYISKDSLFSIFINNTSTGDNRFGFDESKSPIKYFSNYVTGMDQEIPVFSKIKVVRDGEDKTNDLGFFGSFIIFSRLEDMMLLRAEALCVLNRLDDAVIYLNEIRSMRGLKSLSYLKDLHSSPEILLKEIFEERRRELMGEGYLWFDQVRRARILGDNPAMVALINEGGIYWPVAEEVLRANPEIVQNVYWNNKR